MPRSPGRLARSIARRFRRNIAEPARFAIALMRWKKPNFHDSPIIFGNSMPKSGSKLLLQILQGVCKSGPFAYVNPSGIRTYTAQGLLRPQEEISRELEEMTPGIIRYGYLFSAPENIAFLCQPNWVSFLILRDPRDLLISHVFYATDMHAGHRMHQYYLEQPDMEARLMSAIQGVSQGEFHLPDVRTRYDHFLGWLERPEVMILRFEDVINQRQQTLAAIVERFAQRGFPLPIEKEKAIQNIETAIQPRRSPTFRSGKTGEWKKHFTEEHKRLFKDVAGDLLIQLGYEKDNNW
jgi:sulfotransferase 6B1